MLWRGFFTSKKNDVFMSFILHALLLSSVFIVFPGWKKPEIPPVLTIQLVKLPVTEIKTRRNITATTFVKKPPKNLPEKTPIHSSPAAPVIKKQPNKNTTALSEKKPAQDAWLKKQEILQERKKIEKNIDQEFLENIQKITQKNLQVIPKLKLPQLKDQNDYSKQEDATKIQQKIASYVAIIRQRVADYWQYPPDVTGQMKATITVSLTSTGELTQILLEKSSTNPSFDKSVLQAVRKAAPFDFFRQLDFQLFENFFQTFTLIFSPQDLME